MACRCLLRDVSQMTKPDAIEYAVNGELSADEFIALLESSMLAERRPVEDRACMEAMVKNANLTITARHQGKLIGIARSVTDFAYCCYLSDLAVDVAWQKHGVGKKLIEQTQAALYDSGKVVLLAAPAAHAYYERIGMTPHPRCWTLDRHDSLKD